MSSTPNSILSTGADSLPLRFNTLAEWLNWQERLHFTAIELGLERCRMVAERLDLLEPAFTVVSIAGTNGKGSSAAMLDSILRGAGYRVGRYTSPHLVRYNERVCINGMEVSDAALCRSFQRIDEARGDISLTFFEFGTLAALDIFHREGIELAVMEVGLGGRLDAVNILDADVSLVTTVALDHERWLGYDRESIGREKAGIFRPGRPAVCADLAPPESVRQVAQITGARLLQAGRDFEFLEAEFTWSWRSAAWTLVGIPRPSVNHGRQVHNAAGVLMVLEVLSDRFPVPPASLYGSLGEFRLPGRFQVVPGPVTLIFDVAHNPQAASVLAANLDHLPCGGETHVVIGMLKDKNHAAVMQALCGRAGYWYVAGLDGERGAPAAQLLEALLTVPHGGRVSAFEQVPAALAAALEKASPADRILVTGSFVTVGAALKCLDIGT